MADAERVPYVAHFALGLGGGVILHRYRAPRGGLHMMRLVHRASGITVGREYRDGEAPVRVMEELTARLQAELAEIGQSWERPKPDA